MIMSFSLRSRKMVLAQAEDRKFIIWAHTCTRGRIISIIRTISLLKAGLRTSLSVKLKTFNSSLINANNREVFYGGMMEMAQSDGSLTGA